MSPNCRTNVVELEVYIRLYNFRSNSKGEIRDSRIEESFRFRLEAYFASEKGDDSQCSKTT